MKVILKKLRITNFKGIRNLEVDFKSDTNYICGGNGTGKTSVFDAFLWLLFGKDSGGKKDFEIKTLDTNGKEIPRIEHNVAAVIEVDGQDKIFSRTLREKWVKKRGSVDEVFDGNETLYEIDNVPLKQSEYQGKVSEIIDEEVFRLVTNPAEFCNRKWQVQRQILMDIAELNSDLEIATEKQLQGVIDILNSDKTVEERSKELAAGKKKINKEIEAIPIRIDEIKRTLVNDVRDTETVSEEIKGTKEQIRVIERDINILKDGNTARLEAETKIKQYQAEMAQAEAEHKAVIAEIKADNDRALREHKSAVEKLEHDIKYHKGFITECKKGIEELNVSMERLRDEFKAERDKRFDATVCPTCGRVWENDDFNKRLEHFNEEKARKLEEINKKGANKKSSLENNQVLLIERTRMLEDTEKELEILKNTPVSQKEIPVFNSAGYIQKIEKAKAELESNVVDTSRQEAELVILNSKLATLEQELADANGEAKRKERIAELEASLKDKAQAVADIEKEEAEIKEFTEAKINMLGEAVNSKFGIVKFKLYDTQINGGYAECCEATVNGVPYSRGLNSAARINAGLDIIRTLQRYYDVYAPVFVDNKESVTELVNMDCQLVCLQVTDDKELIINDIKVKEVA